MTKQLEEGLTDFTDYLALPSPIQAEIAIVPETPVTDGSFSIVPENDLLAKRRANNAYNAYLRLPKGLATGTRVEELAELSELMATSANPVHQAAAGWTAVESALMSKSSMTARLSRLEEGVTAWIHSAASQRRDLSDPSGSRINVTQPLRTDRAISTAPLLESIIRARVTEQVVRMVVSSNLELAWQTRLLRDESNEDAEILRDYAGFNSELLFQLTHDLPLNIGRLALPATMKADSGHYRKDETHDAISAFVGKGRVHIAIPVEIKGHLVDLHRNRYRALLIAGKRPQVLVDGEPVDMRARLEALDAVYKGTETTQQRRIVVSMQHSITTQLAMYQGSRRIRRLSPKGSVTIFHDQFGKEQQVTQPTFLAVDEQG